MFNKQGKEFKVWTENGKYFYKASKLARKQEISKEKFKEILANQTITSIGFTQNQSLGLYELIEHGKKHNEEKTSEFGRRVNVVILEAKQKESKDGGVDVYFKLDILDEKTKDTDVDLFTITGNVKGVTGPLTDKGVYYPEAFRSFYQLAFNGFLANDEDSRKIKEALNEEHKKKPMIG